MWVCIDSIYCIIILIKKQVNSNGVISIGMRDQAFPPQRFPTMYLLIAPFWADVDTSSGVGTVVYGLPTSSATIAAVQGQIRTSFPSQATFVPEYVLIATWSGVGHYNRKTKRVSYNNN